MVRVLPLSTSVPVSGQINEGVMQMLSNEIQRKMKNELSMNEWREECADEYLHETFVQFCERIGVNDVDKLLIAEQLDREAI